MSHTPKLSVERDRQPVVLAGLLRGFAAWALQSVGQLKRSMAVRSDNPVQRTPKSGVAELRS
jgi:hypothetical protein